MFREEDPMANKATVLIAACAAVIGMSLAAIFAAPGFLSKTGVIGTTGKPLVGGPFELVKHTGETVTDKDFRGRYMLIYFGFTYCPDICPSSLQIMTSALEDLDAATLEKITPVFVTVDPERDTPQLMAEYVSNFHPKLIGLTGSQEQVSKAVKAYRVFAQKQKTGEGADEYTMDHSSFYYLIGPDGNFLTHFNHGVAPGKLAESLKRRVSGS
jgi:cytochrome oxidase Cu insertion factor (SCO1/SenC/PrrC family)